jgi:hypothetical protein
MHFYNQNISIVLFNKTPPLQAFRLDIQKIEHIVSAAADDPALDKLLMIPDLKNKLFKNMRTLP